MKTQRAELWDALQEADADVARREAALDVAERPLRECPQALAAFEGDPDEYDAAGIAGEANAVRAALPPVQAALSHVLCGSGIRPTFAEAKVVLAGLHSLLATLPEPARLEEHAALMARLGERREVRSAAMAEAAEALGVEEADVPMVYAAARGLHALKATHGMSGLHQAEAALRQLVAERGSLRRLREAWGRTVSDLGLGDVDKDAFVSACEQVVALGTEAILSYRRLPAGGRATLADFGERCRTARESRARLVASHGDAWLGKSASRFRKAADAASSETDPNHDLALKYAGSLGITEGVPGTLREMAECSALLEGLETDVQAAKVLGGKFAGGETDADAELEAVDRWYWLLDEAEGSAEAASVASACTRRDPGALLALERDMAALLDTVSEHEANYGNEWPTHDVDSGRIAELASRIKAVTGAGTCGPDAFERVSKAFDACARAGEVGHEVVALMAATSDAPDGTVRRLRSACSDLLRTMFPNADFLDLPEDLETVASSVSEGRDALAGIYLRLAKMNGHARRDVVDVNSPIAQAADTLPFLAMGEAVAVARAGWIEAHEARHAAQEALRAYDLDESEREEAHEVSRRENAILARAAAEERAREQETARSERREAEVSVTRESGPARQPTRVIGEGRTPRPEATSSTEAPQVVAPEATAPEATAPEAVASDAAPEILALGIPAPEGASDPGRIPPVTLAEDETKPSRPSLSLVPSPEPARRPVAPPKAPALIPVPDAGAGKTRGGALARLLLAGTRPGVAGLIPDVGIDSPAKAEWVETHLNKIVDNNAKSATS